MNLSEKLKHCRKNADLTQLQVASRLNVSRKTISGWENGHSYPDAASLVKLSDIYKVSTDDLLRDNRLLRYYESQEHFHQKSKKIEIISYYLGILLWLLSYIEFFQPAGIHSFIIPIAVVTNTLVYLTHFSNWNRFQSTKYNLRAIIFFIFVLVAHVMINIIDSNFLNFMNHSELHFLVGFMMGRIFLVLIISVALEIIVFFHPFKET